MNQLRLLDDRVFLAVNAWARQTPALHGPALGYARHGTVLFGALLLAAVVVARHRSSRELAATGWAAVATLLAVALNQPLGQVFGEARPYVTHPGVLRLGDVTGDFSFPPTTPSWRAPWPPGCSWPTAASGSSRRSRPC